MATRKQRFDAYRTIINDATSRPFEYGTNDCVLLIARAVRAITGVDYAPAFQPYDVRSAARLLRNAGGLVPFISQFLGEPETDTSQLRVCDAVVVSSVGQDAAAGLWNGQSVTCLAASGAIGVSAMHIDAFWRIG